MRRNDRASAAAADAPLVAVAAGIAGDRGGRAPLRQALYMPALVAIRFDAMRTKSEALLAAGEPPEVALVAIRRRLVILANALLRAGRTWTPTPA